MAEVGSARGAQGLGADHAVAIVVLGVDNLGGHRLPKAWPTASGVVLGVAIEKMYSADHAAVHTWTFLGEVCTRKGRFGTGFLGAVKGHGGESILEFFSGFGFGHEPDGSASKLNGGLLAKILASNACSQLRCCHSKVDHRHTVFLGLVDVVTFPD